jgi:hypothetical protein
MTFMRSLCGFLYGIITTRVLSYTEMIVRRTIRLTSIKVQLRITHMDVCCGPPCTNLSSAM